MTRHRRVSLSLALVALLACTPACSSGDDGSAQAASGKQRPKGPPQPGSKEDIVQVFGPELDRLGLRVTRAGLLARAGVPGYTPTGRHLAVYVEPLGKVDASVYVANLVPLAQVFMPEVFDRYGQIDSFDVCQEPPPGTDDRPEPPPLTQLVANRSHSKAVDWNTVTVKGLLAAAKGPDPLGVGVAAEISATPAWARAVA